MRQTDKLWAQLRERDPTLVSEVNVSKGPRKTLFVSFWLHAQEHMCPPRYSYTHVNTHTHTKKRICREDRPEDAGLGDGFI